MKLLVLNCGSASVKYRLFEAGTGDAIAELGGGLVENVASYEHAVRSAIAAVVPDPREIGSVGHRVVHGGDRFRTAALIDEGVAAEIERISHLAPLHNPVNLLGYRAAKALLPDCPQVAVFDTAFHQTMPPHAYLYSLPWHLYQRHSLRRFGFHGTSYRYITLRYAELRGGQPEDFKLIVCHLGNGCSVCAVQHGRSVDTSMGFTPLEGLVMGSRGGDLDPGALLHLMEQEKLDPASANRLLNRECGLLGLSGASNDMRTLLARTAEGDERAKLAVDSFCYRVRKYIGSYWAAMNGADAVVFTAGIGENAAPVRSRICEGLDSLGIALDPERNQAAIGRESELSAPGARTQVWTIPTREELMIARDTLAAVLSAAPPAAR